MSKFYAALAIASVLIAGSLYFESSYASNHVVIDFSTNANTNSAGGDTIEGLGIFHPNLDIRSLGTGIIIEQGVQGASYVASTNNVQAGCIGNTFGMGNAANSGFNSRGDFDFVFNGRTVDQFSIQVYDHDDFSTNATTTHDMIATAYDVNGVVVATTQYPVPLITNTIYDACDSAGIQTLSLSQPGIARVDIRQVGADSGVGFDNLSFRLEPNSDIQIEKTTDKPLYVNDDHIVYEVVVRNMGPDDATDLIISENYVGLEQDGVSNLSYEGPTHGTLEDTFWDIGTLAAGDKATLTIEADIDACQWPSLGNVAYVMNMTGMDPISSDNAASVKPELSCDPSGNIDEEIITKNFHFDDKAKDLTILKTPPQNIWLKQISCTIQKGESSWFSSITPRMTLSLPTIDDPYPDSFGDTLDVSCAGEPDFNHQETMPSGKPIYLPHGTEFKVSTNSGGVYSVNIWLQVEVDDTLLEIKKSSTSSDDPIFVGDGPSFTTP